MLAPVVLVTSSSSGRYLVLPHGVLGTRVPCYFASGGRLYMSGKDNICLSEITGYLDICWA